jgi:hypothetical protein
MFRVPAAAMVVVPVPLIVPPVQFSVLTEMLSLPVRVPLKFTTAGVVSALPLLKFPVPLMFSGPVRPLKFAPAVKFTVPVILTLPSPLTPPPRFCVPPRERVAPAAAVKFPLLVLVAPGLMLSVPLCADTVPLLLKGPLWLMLNVPVPADFFSVPALVNVVAAPPALKIP